MGVSARREIVSEWLWLSLPTGVLQGSCYSSPPHSAFDTEQKLNSNQAVCISFAKPLSIVPLPRGLWASSGPVPTALTSAGPDLPGGVPRLSGMTERAVPWTQGEPWGASGL